MLRGEVLWMELCAGEGFFSELFLRFSRGIHSADFLTLLVQVLVLVTSTSASTTSTSNPKD